jgi:hypothetical protein
MSYYKITGKHARDIIAETVAQEAKLIADLTALTGVKVTGYQRQGNLAFAIATIVSVECDEQPTEKGWVATRKEPGYYEPSRRVKLGKELSEKLVAFTPLGVLPVLKKFGVNPWPVSDGFPKGVSGVSFSVDRQTILIQTQEDWTFEPAWPDWVKEIKGSEFNAEMEKMKQAHSKAEE